MSVLNQTSVNAKLDSLNESQDSIVAIAQWIMFHRRAPQQIAQMWLVHLQQAPANKKLALMYLCNEVVQQSRNRKKFEFVNAFAEIIPTALQDVKRTASPEVNAKVRRMVEVWKQRSIFAASLTEAFLKIEDSASAHSRKRSISISDSPRLVEAETVPPAIAKLASLQSSLDTNAKSFNESQSKFNQLHKALFDAESLPAPEVYVQKLDELDQVLNSVYTKAKSLQISREAVANQLSTLLDMQTQQLKQLQTVVKDLEGKRNHIAETRDELESMNKAGGAMVENDDEDFAPPIYSPISDDEENEPALPAAKKAKIETGKSKEEPDKETKDEQSQTVNSSPGTGYSTPGAPGPSGASQDEIENPEPPASEQADSSGEGDYDPLAGSAAAVSGPSLSSKNGYEGLDPKVADFLSQLVNK